MPRQGRQSCFEPSFTKIAGIDRGKSASVSSGMKNGSSPARSYVGSFTCRFRLLRPREALLTGTTGCSWLIRMETLLPFRKHPFLTSCSPAGVSQSRFESALAGRQDCSSHPSGMTRVSYTPQRIVVGTRRGPYPHTLCGYAKLLLKAKSYRKLQAPAPSSYSSTYCIRELQEWRITIQGFHSANNPTAVASIRFVC